jgi:hypothetical protein
MASLTSVRVPPSAVPVLKRLAELDDERADALVSALSTGDARDKPAIQAAVSAVVGDDWDDDDIKDLVGNLIAMSTLGTSHNFSASAVGEALVTST